MAKKTLILAILIAMMVLPSMWGQNAPVTMTVAGAQIGVASDGSTWTTVLHWTNLLAGDWNQGTLQFLDADGAVTPADVQLASGMSMSGRGGQTGGPNTYASEMNVLTSTGAPKMFTLQLQSAGGYGLYAVVQHRDASGNILSSKAITDLSFLPSGPLQAFGVPLDLGANLGERLTFTNGGSVTANVTLNAYDGSQEAGARPPFASVTVSVGPGSRLSGHVAELFASNPNFASFLAQSFCSAGGQQTCPLGTLNEGYLTASSDQPLSLAATREDIGQGGAVVSTVLPVFSAAPMVNGVSGVNLSTGAWTTTIAPSQCIVLFGSFAPTGNTVTTGGQSLDILFESATQINVLDIRWESGVSC